MRPIDSFVDVSLRKKYVRGDGVEEDVIKVFSWSNDHNVTPTVEKKIDRFVEDEIQRIESQRPDVVYVRRVCDKRQMLIGIKNASALTRKMTNKKKDASMIDVVRILRVSTMSQRENSHPQEGIATTFSTMQQQQQQHSAPHNIFHTYADTPHYANGHHALPTGHNNSFETPSIRTNPPASAPSAIYGDNSWATVDAPSLHLSTNHIVGRFAQDVSRRAFPSEIASSVAVKTKKMKREKLLQNYFRARLERNDAVFGTSSDVSNKTTTGEVVMSKNQKELAIAFAVALFEEQKRHIPYDELKVILDDVTDLQTREEEEEIMETENDDDEDVASRKTKTSKINDVPKTPRTRATRLTNFSKVAPSIKLVAGVKKTQKK